MNPLWLALVLPLLLPLSAHAGEDPDLLPAVPAAAAPERSSSATEAPPLPLLSADDRVKSVQRKPFLKESRFELTPLAFAVLNNAFFPKYGTGLRLGYHLSDSFAVAASLRQFSALPSDNVRLAKRELQSRLDAIEPRVGYDISLLWTPIYGKVALFDSIHHFDFYLIGGVGGLRSSSDEGTHIATHVGLGQRISLTRFLTLDLSLLDTLYADKVPGSLSSQMQHDLSFQVGLGIFFPFSSPSSSGSGELAASGTSQLPAVSGSRYGKAKKFEISPTFGVSLGDAFFQKYMAGAKLAYHLSSDYSIGIGARYALNTPAGSLSVCDANGVCRGPGMNQLRDVPGRLGLIAGAEFGWTPIYGKMNLVSEGLIHFDLGLVAGLDAIQYQAPAGKNALTLGAHLGIGQRWFLGPSTALRIELRDYLYRAEIVPLEQTDHKLESQLMLEIGLSFFSGSGPETSR